MPRVFPLPHIARAVLVVGNGEANLLRGHSHELNLRRALEEVWVQICIVGVEEVFLCKPCIGQAFGASEPDVAYLAWPLIPLHTICAYWKTTKVHGLFTHFMPGCLNLFSVWWKMKGNKLGVNQGCRFGNYFGIRVVYFGMFLEFEKSHELLDNYQDQWFWLKLLKTC